MQRIVEVVVGWSFWQWVWCLMAVAVVIDLLLLLQKKLRPLAYRFAVILGVVSYINGVISFVDVLMAEGLTLVVVVMIYVLHVAASWYVIYGWLIGLERIKYGKISAIWLKYIEIFYTLIASASVLKLLISISGGGSPRQTEVAAIVVLGFAVSLKLAKLTFEIRLDRLKSAEIVST